MTAPSRIALESVTHVWTDRHSEHVALSDVSLSVTAGEFLTVSGPSGAGKSTLLSIMGTLTRPTRGDVFLGDEFAWGMLPDELASLRGGALAFVFQHAELVGSLCALDNVMLPLILRKVPSVDAREVAVAALTRFGLDHRARALPGQLSGGERRRVALARAVASNPSFVLADEPTGDLDPVSARVVIDTLSSLASDGCGIVVVTHDPVLAAAGSRRVHLDRGRVVDE